MKSTARTLLGIAILLAGIGISFLIFHFKPVAENVIPQKPIPNVEVVTVERTNAPVIVSSQGIVQAATRTSVASEVSGRVIEADPRFEVGGDFQDGEVILLIDSADYESALAQAEANVAKATLELSMEEGRVRQAERDWQKLGGDAAAPPLALRQPQLRSAEASLKAANAAVEKARLDVERCTIKAPYDCRVVAKHTDLGSFIPAAGRVADLESLGTYEVRLPVPIEDFSFIDVADLTQEGKRPPVTLTATIGNTVREWPAEIVRTEGSVDRESRSIHLVARITSENAKDDILLQPGLFLRASITGITMEGVLPVPREALYEGDVVLVVDEKDTINRRPVTVLRTTIETAYVSDHLEVGERVCLTPINAAIEDMPVKVVDPDKDATDDKASEPETTGVGKEQT